MDIYNISKNSNALALRSFYQHCLGTGYKLYISQEADNEYNFLFNKSNDDCRCLNMSLLWFASNKSYYSNQKSNWW